MNRFDEWANNTIGGIFAAIGAFFTGLLALIGVGLYFLFWIALAIVVFNMACNILR